MFVHNNRIALLFWAKRNQFFTRSFVFSRSGMNNYYIWKLAETYVPYLSVKFRDIVKIYNTDLTGEKELPPRWETCVSLLQRFMGFGVAASIEQNIENKKDIEDEVKTVFDNIKDTIRAHVDNNRNMVPELREHVLDKVKYFFILFSTNCMRKM